MAKTITIQISDADYDDLVNHLAKDLPGRPLVAVYDVRDSFTKDAVENRAYQLGAAAAARDDKAVR